MNKCFPLTAMLVLASTAIIQFAAAFDDAITQDDRREKPAPKRQADRDKLTPFQFLVGGWKGVGQLKRGSNEGAWSEQSEWVWKFTPNSAALEFTTESPRYFVSGTLRPTDNTGEFLLSMQPTKDVLGAGQKADAIEYRGARSKDGQLLLTSDDVPEALPNRISVRSVASGDRLIVLYEKRSPVSDRYSRLSEVGFTRKGSGFGQGSNGPECVVTGGFGSMMVTYKGESYPVCCTGCRDVFNDDPERTLAEYRAKKAEEKQKRGKK